MPVVARITIPHACGCCPGDGPWLVVGECESRTGTAVLCGHSGFAFGYDPDEPWAWPGQMRKWRDRTLSGSNGLYRINSDTAEWIRTRRDFYQGTGTIEACVGEECAGPCTSTDDYTWSSVTYNTPDPEIAYEDVTPGVFDGGPDLPGVFADQAYVATSLTELAMTAGTPGGGDTYYSDIKITLTVEATWWDALETAEDLVEGDSCCAETEEADETTPESTSPITATLTAVRVPLFVNGCDEIGTPVTVYVKLQQGDDEFVVETIAFCGVQSYYILPQPPPPDPEDPDWPDALPICFVAASLDEDGLWITPS